LKAARDVTSSHQSAPRPSESGAARSAIIRVSVDLFGRFGYEATSMQDIARRVGMKAPSLYNHFGSKGELFVVALADVLDQFAETVLEPIDPTESSVDQLMGVVRRYVHFELGPSHARTAELLLEADRLGRHLPDDIRLGISAAERRIYETVRDLAEQSVGEGAPAVDGAVVTWTIINACHRVGTWFNAGYRLTADEVATEICQLVLHILGQPATVGSGSFTSGFHAPSTNEDAIPT